MQVTVIGGGVLGCAIGLELRRAGFDVAVVDRHGEVGHGSTSASCGIVRRFYSQPGMIAMAHEAAHIWADWSAWLGPIDDDLAVFHRPGMLLLPPVVDDGVRGVARSMREIGIDARVLTADEVAERFPFLDTASHHPPRLPSDPAFFDATGRSIEGAVFEADAGFVVSPGLATHNLRLAGEREGVRFRLGTEIVSIRRPASGRFELVTGDGEVLESEIVVNASGPHSGRVNRMAGVALPLETRPLRREVHALANPVFDEAAGSPVPVVGDLDGGIYFRPESGGRDIVVGSTEPACDEPEMRWLDDPDDNEPYPSQRCFRRQALRLMKRLPAVRLGPKRGVAALYDVTVRDWYPIVDKTELPGFYVCIGSSGSSFKTAPVLGTLVARLVTAGAEGRDTDREPLRLELPRTGASTDVRFLSRLRGDLDTTGTVIG